MKRLSNSELLPTPFEVALLIGVSYFFWFFADGFDGVAYAAAGILIAIVVNRALLMNKTKRIPPEAAWLALGLVFAFTAPFIASGDFRVTQLAIVAYTALIVVGLNLLSGNLGQVSFAHAAFVGIGAYTVAICVNEWDMPILLAMALAAVVAALGGVLLGVPAVRLSGPYLAIATAGLGIIFPAFLTIDEISEYTGGFQGISLFSHKYSAPIDLGWLSDERWYYFLSLSALIAGVFLAFNLVNSAAGRALRAVHDSELAATAMGINVPYTKVTTFALSAAYAGFGGGLLFLVGNRFVAPDGFGVLIAVDFLVAVVLGGVATIAGSLLGGFFFVYFYTDGLDTITSQTEGGQDQWLIITGILISAALIFGNTYAVTLSRRAIRQIGKFGPPIVFLAKIGLSCAVGLGLAFLFRQGAEHVFNINNLRSGITGMTLILIILFMPNGVIGLVNGMRKLTWQDVGSWIKEILPAEQSETPAASASPARSLGQPE